LFIEDRHSNLDAACSLSHLRFVSRGRSVNWKQSNIGSKANEIGTNALTFQMSYPTCMDHLEVLREKIGRLRVEIAEIHELNKQYRRQDWNETDAQVAHGQRHERLQAIQQELPT
jgi:hypothetical protein